MSKQEEPKKRVRLGCMVKPENLEAVKQIKVATAAKSEGAVIDNAIQHYHKRVQCIKR